MRLTNLIIAVISIICFFGIWFVGLLAHELTHVIQSETPVSICYDFQQSTFSHVEHKSNLSEGEWDKFNAYTEKWAKITDDMIGYLASFVYGVLLTLSKTKKKK